MAGACVGAGVKKLASVPSVGSASSCSGCRGRCTICACCSAEGTRARLRANGWEPPESAAEAEGDTAHRRAQGHWIRAAREAGAAAGQARAGPALM